jgi:uncharacterized protein (DUF2252 family)
MGTPRKTAAKPQKTAQAAPAPAPSAPAPLQYQAMLPHPTPAERVSRGKASRQETPRRSQGFWEPWANRPDPVALLEEQAATRWTELVPIRHGRMLASPFAFFRGGAYIMASDLATTPRTGIKVQACGDAHLVNFGIFSAPDRRLVFDMNDFDETLPGPWEWDVKRLAASFEVAMRDRGIEPAARRDVLLTVVRSYRENMTAFAAMTNVDVWYARLSTDTLLEKLKAEEAKASVKSAAKVLAKAQSKNSMRALGKLTVMVDGEPRIISQPPLLVPAAELLQGESLEQFNTTIHEFLRNYSMSLPDDRRSLLEGYEFRQIARKVVGVGSVGLRSWIVLATGRDNSDPLFLQLKQAEASVLERFVGRSRYRNHGRRVVEGQRLTQAASDIMLGWYKVLAFDGKVHDFYVRQLWDGKASVDIGVMPISLFDVYARMCGWTLARGHARTGDRIALAAYLGVNDVFDNAIADFAVAYADQNERDFELMQAAAKSGRIQAEMGV